MVGKPPKLPKIGPDGLLEPWPKPAFSWGDVWMACAAVLAFALIFVVYP